MPDKQWIHLMFEGRLQLCFAVKPQKGKHLFSFLTATAMAGGSMFQSSIRLSHSCQCDISVP